MVSCSRAHEVLLLLAVLRLSSHEVIGWPWCVVAVGRCIILQGRHYNA